MVQRYPSPLAGEGSGERGSLRYITRCPGLAPSSGLSR